MPPRRSPEERPGSPSDHRTVAVLGCAADSAVVADIVSGLREATIDVRPFDFHQTPTEASTSSGPTTVVLVMSMSALSDAEWGEAVEKLDGTEIIPVAIGDLDDHEVPGHVKPINWVLWQPDSIARSVVKVLTAVRLDAGRYRLARLLKRSVSDWTASGRKDDFLVHDLSTALRYQDELSQPEGALTAHLDSETRELARALIARSLFAARKRRRRRRGGLLTRIGATLLLGVGIAAAVVVIPHFLRNNISSFSAAQDTPTDRADLTALKLTALLASSDLTPTDQQIIEQLLYAALDLHWSSGVVGVPPYEWALNDVTFGSDESTVLTATGGGALAYWDIDSGELIRETPLVTQPLYQLAVDRNGRPGAVSGGDFIGLIDDSGTTVIMVDVPILPLFLAIADVGETVVGADTGTIVVVAPDGSVDSSQWDRVFDVRVAEDGAIVALVRSGGTISVIDVLTGQARTSASLEQENANTGAIFSDGYSYVMGQSGTPLLYSGGDGVLEPSGYVVPSGLSAIGAADDGYVLVSTSSRGVQYVSLALGVAILDVCPGYGVAGTVRVDSEGTVACAKFGIVVFDSIRHASPTPAQGSLVSVTTEASQTGRVREVMVDGTTSYQITTETADGEPLYIHLQLDTRLAAETEPDSIWMFSSSLAWPVPPGTEASAVAIAPGGNSFALGTGDGRVIEFDVDTLGIPRRVSEWLAPTRAPVLRIQWTDDGDRLVETGDGLVWTTRTCVDCYLDIDVVLDQVADRVWSCYDATLGQAVSREVQDRFGISYCDATSTVGRPDSG